MEDKKDFLGILDIPLYENRKREMYGYKFHDVIINMTRISLFIKYDILYKEDDDDDD